MIHASKDVVCIQTLIAMIDSTWLLRSASNTKKLCKTVLKNVTCMHTDCLLYCFSVVCDFMPRTKEVWLKVRNVHTYPIFLY